MFMHGFGVLAMEVARQKKHGKLYEADKRTEI
jgi:hypothetical protein